LPWDESIPKTRPDANFGSAEDATGLQRFTIEHKCVK
jgi:hypothetical protein